MTPQQENAGTVEEGEGATSPTSDDMFGPLPPPAARPRVPMINARLRANEERKRVIKICSQKLENIKDPACDLRRSVCINNTYCRLSEEVQREKEARRGGCREPSAILAASPTDAVNTLADRALDRALASIESELAAIGAAPPPPDRELLSLEPAGSDEPRKRCSLTSLGASHFSLTPKRPRTSDDRNEEAEACFARMLDAIPELNACATLARRDLPMLLPNMISMLDS